VLFLQKNYGWPQNWGPGSKMGTHVPPVLGLKPALHACTVSKLSKLVSDV